jgi:hypothetical protein
MHISGILHPLLSIPPEQIMFSGPQLAGQNAGHSFPSRPRGPIIGMHISGIMHPLESIPPGHVMLSGPHSDGAISGHMGGIAATVLKIRGIRY